MAAAPTPVSCLLKPEHLKSRFLALYKTLDQRKERLDSAKNATAGWCSVRVEGVGIQLACERGFSPVCSVLLSRLQ